ncbi:putative neutral sphingomyelinase [Echinococcus granulosus]|uniref:sphingomyelin phosphodiesterase n=1 Tax=Echinococcus granulosus TaxID=6210 RepID=A0A068WGV9_ECHGR|nr:putative neutral sphingomyelinase [Echinococcus granulosus]CDS18995.1 neutral sphingomyelinase [Echinococcus granulosus]
METDNHATPGLTERIKILTLNCWGIFIKGMTVQKDVRVDAICELLRKSDCDIIFLQEVWLQSDFEKIRASLGSIYPHCVKFHAHLFGSGLCIFCRWPLVSFMALPFSINGYPHYIHQADWVAGKAMGYASTITPSGFRLNLYNAHTHARHYLNHDDDPVEGHRLVQAIEMMEFIRASAASSDAIFIGGDLNLEPYTTALRLLKRSLHLKDAWLDQTARRPVVSVEEMELEGATCERGDCPYAHKKWTASTGNGLRLDYIFYRPGVINDGLSTVTVECERCQVDMTEVPHKPGVFYSDHAVVTAEFLLTMHEESIAEEVPPINSHEALETILMEADGIIKTQMKMENKRRTTHLVIAALLIVAFLTLGTGVPVCHPAYKFFASALLMLAGAIVFCLIWGNVIGRPCLMSSLRNAKAIVWNHLNEFIQAPASNP